MIKNINIYTLSDNFLNKGRSNTSPTFKILLIGVYKYDRKFSITESIAVI